MATISTTSALDHVIPASLIQRIQALFADEGFAPVDFVLADRTLTFSATKGLLWAHVHVTVGKHERGRRATAMALMPPIAPSDEPVIIPTAPFDATMAAVPPD
jgi:hypothetical protein